MASIKEGWGTGALGEVLAPGRVADERFRSWYARSGRIAGGPDLVAEMVTANFAADLRPLLPRHFLSHSGPAS